MPSADPTLISIPSELLPGDGRFGSGPSKVRPEAVSALAARAVDYLGTSHRQPTVKSVVGRVRSGLTELFGLPDGWEIVLGNGGTTLFWDAAVFGLIEKQSLHVSFGEFSSKFAAAAKAAPFLETPVVMEVAPGTTTAPVSSAGADAYCLTHNETSTGVMAPLLRAEGADAGSLVLVDATSGAGALRWDPAAVDVYYFAPQKVFAADGGLWLAAVSPLGIERIERLARSDRWIPAGLDLKIALDNSRLDQTYNTPALATLFLLADQLDWINGQGGLEWSASRCERSAEILYGWAESSSFATPFVEKPDERSKVVGTIDFDAAVVDANALAKALRTNGIVDTESYRKLGRNQLRIAMFPAIEPDDVAQLTRCIDFCVDRLRTGG